MTITERIKTYVRESLATELRDHDDIFDLGLANSLFALQLVLFIEREFSIVAQRTDLDIRNFCSVAAMSAFVARKLGKAADNGDGPGAD